MRKLNAMLPPLILRKTFLAVIYASVLLQLLGCENKEDIFSQDYPPLSHEEIHFIEDFVDNSVKQHSSVQNLIGQIFMVGIPADFSTIQDTQRDAVNSLIGDLGIGMALVNSYNYYDRKDTDDSEYISKIINFNNLLQSKTKYSATKFPLLIATDLESSNYSSIKRSLVLPPSALTLGSSQNGKLIETIGYYIGTELTGIGIQIILGPVLDTYNVRQGNKFVLQDRCFASTAEGVTRTASHYILGLSQSGVLVFAKHIPGHGSIETNPHDEHIPLYEGSISSLKGELIPFIDSQKGIDGIMTSHILVPNLKSESLATFSQEIMNLISKNNLGNV